MVGEEERVGWWKVWLFEEGNTAYPKHLALLVASKLVLMIASVEVMRWLLSR